MSVFLGQTQRAYCSLFVCAVLSAQRILHSASLFEVSTCWNIFRLYHTFRTLKDHSSVFTCFTPFTIKLLGIKPYLAMSFKLHVCRISIKDSKLKITLVCPTMSKLILICWWSSPLPIMAIHFKNIPYFYFYLFI